MKNQKCIKYLDVLITKPSCDDGVGDNGVEKEPPAKLDVILRPAKEKKMWEGCYTLPYLLDVLIA